MRSVVVAPILLLLLPGCELASDVGRFRVDEDSCAYADEVTADGPAGYWRLDDDPSSSSAHDEVGALDGDNQGGSFGAAGLVGCEGTAVQLSDAAQIVIGDAFAFDGNAPFTVEAWVAPDPTPGDIVSRRDGTDRGWVLRITSARTLGLFRILGGLFVEGAESDPLPTGARHVAGRYNPNGGPETACVFINGVKSRCGVAPTPIAGAQGPVAIGANGYSGVIDEVAIYDRPVSDERLGAHFSAAQ
jgi:hypothetical protein